MFHFAAPAYGLANNAEYAWRGREGLGGAGVALGAEGDSGLIRAGRQTSEKTGTAGNRQKERTTRWGCDSANREDSR
ncbi:unnamed protein product [Rangifer tarandus platyrhynchus]|uniref:Uncharacterized protein n=1 Tax=Rangifer tarandus platyrhynchus TaxID=3082113 RepID=A0AC59Y2Z8_RANTA